MYIYGNEHEKKEKLTYKLAQQTKQLNLWLGAWLLLFCKDNETTISLA